MSNIMNRRRLNKLSDRRNVQDMDNQFSNDTRNVFVPGSRELAC